jgi:tetratricopeptide (TPR) repeat protein
MLKPKKKVKITKKELKQDKFVIFTLKAKDYIETHTKLITQVSVGILVLIVLITLYVRSKHNANIQANAMLGEAQIAQTTGNMQRAEEVLKQLVDEYDGTRAAGDGCFMLAKLYWERNDTTNAKTYFKKYFDDYADDDLLTAAAMAGYADCLMWEKNPAEAAKYYEKAARVNKNNPLTPSYLYSAAAAYYDAGNFSKARELAQELVDNYKNSQYKLQAEIIIRMVDEKA